MEMDKIARWAFAAFVIIAIVMGLAVGYMAWNADNTYNLGWADSNVSNTNGYVTLILLILGISRWSGEHNRKGSDTCFSSQLSLS